MELNIVLENNCYNIMDNMILCRNNMGELIRLPLNDDLCQQLGIAQTTDDYNVDDSSESTTELAVPDNEQKSNSLAKWPSVVVKSLIEVYKENMDKFDMSCYKVDDVWDIIAKEMKKLNFKYSLTQCKNKFANLKRVYGKYNDNLKVTGAAPIKFDYVDEFNDLFGKDHNITPPNLFNAIDNNNKPIKMGRRNLIEEIENQENDVESCVPITPTPKVNKRKRSSDNMDLIKAIEKSRDDRNRRFAEMLEVRKAQQEEQTRISEVFNQSLNRLIERL